MELLNILEEIMPLYWWASGIIGFFVIILLINNIRISRRLKKFESSYITLQTFMSGKKLDDLLEGFINNLDEQTTKIKDSDRRIAKVEEKLRASVDNVTLSRFNAFENMGGELSFALSLLNQNGDGVVLTSIHSREESRVYAKTIKNGESKQQLSKEEREVIIKGMDSVKI